MYIKPTLRQTRPPTRAFFAGTPVWTGRLADLSLDAARCGRPPYQTQVSDGTAPGQESAVVMARPAVTVRRQDALECNEALREVRFRRRAATKPAPEPVAAVRARHCPATLQFDHDRRGDQQNDYGAPEHEPTLYRRCHPSHLAVRRLGRGCSNDFAMLYVTRIRRTSAGPRPLPSPGNDKSAVVVEKSTARSREGRPPALRCSTIAADTRMTRRNHAPAPGAHSACPRPGFRRERVPASIRPSPWR